MDLSGLIAAARSQLPCGSCRQVFDNSVDRDQHRQAAHPPIHHCFLCDKRIKCKKIAIHMVRKHKIRGTVTCECCDWTFTNKAKADKHLEAVRTTGEFGVAPIAVTSQYHPERPNSTTNNRTEEEQKDWIRLNTQVAAVLDHQLLPAGALVFPESWKSIVDACNVMTEALRRTDASLGRVVDYNTIQTEPVDQAAADEDK
ncbi:hypothetical protein GCK72_022726 [Caenorhabditis remanei]|nr:hypothetical protein GCK72_022726 [Caenorhabditis remanei]KAF1746273.1 hypothetical protein GCK72_022726 [Caenorhabditis remanei]